MAEAKAIEPAATERLSFLGRFLVLKGAVRELWIIFGAKLLAILAYGVMNTTLVLWLSAGYSNFSVSDIKEPEALAARLKNPAPGDGVSQYVAAQFSESNRALLNASEPHGTKLKLALAETMNRVLTNGPLFEAGRFAGVQLSAETQQSLDQATNTAALAHLNRLLLQDAYPKELEKPSRTGLACSDQSAGDIIATWSMLMTLFTVLVGSLVDAIGLRKAFLLGFGVCIAARGMLTFTPWKWVALPLGLLPLALGEALMTPVMVAAVRRYSTTAQRSMAFAIFYAMMNVGFMIGGFIFDYVRKGLGEYGALTVPWLGLELGTYRTLFLVSFLLTLPNLAVVYFFLRGGVEATDEGVKIVTERPKYTTESLGRAFGLMVRDTLRETARIFAGLWRQPAFFKFLVFLSLVVAVRLIFYHMYYTYPKFGLRELGAGAPLGRLWSINAILIIILVPVVGALTQRIAAYRMVVIGSLVSASSVFIMALPPAWFEGMAAGWPGHVIGTVWLGLPGPVHPYYVMIFSFVALLSVGESLWSPRLYEYTAAIAPKGQEASYMALSYLPFFIAKLFVGLLSGRLLARYCPETGPRESGTLWLIIALTAIITPVGLVVLRKYVRGKEAGRGE